MSTLLPVRRVLDELARRLRLDEDDPISKDRPGLTPVIDVISSLASAVQKPDVEELHKVLPDLAHVRESLENQGGIDQSPWEALVHDKAQGFAAGSLWAASLFIDAALTGAEQQANDRQARSHRAIAREVVRDHIAQFGPCSTTELRLAVDKTGRQVSPSTLSKVIGNLLEREEIHALTPPEGSDRRQRWFRSPVDVDR